MLLPIKPATKRVMGRFRVTDPQVHAPYATCPQCGSPFKYSVRYHPDQTDKGELIFQGSLVGRCIEVCRHATCVLGKQKNQSWGTEFYGPLNPVEMAEYETAYRQFQPDAPHLGDVRPDNSPSPSPARTVPSSSPIKTALFSPTIAQDFAVNRLASPIRFSFSPEVDENALAAVNEVDAVALNQAIADSPYEFIGTTPRPDEILQAGVERYIKELLERQEMAQRLAAERSGTLHALLGAQLTMEAEPSIKHSNDVDDAKRNDYNVLVKVLNLADNIIDSTEGHQKYHAHISYAERLSFDATATLPLLTPQPSGLTDTANIASLHSTQATRRRKRKAVMSDYFPTAKRVRGRGTTSQSATPLNEASSSSSPARYHGSRATHSPTVTIGEIDLVSD